MLTCITYMTGSNYCCSKCLPADIIICVPAEIVIDSLKQSIGDPAHGFVIGQITEKKVFPAQRCNLLWEYTLCFESEQIKTGYNLTTANVVSVMCLDCFMNWVKYKVNSIPVLTTPVYYGEGIYGSGIDGNLTVAGGTERWIPYPARNKYYNNLTIEADGIYHPYGQGYNTGEGTSDGTTLPANPQHVYVYRIAAQNLVIRGTFHGRGKDGIHYSTAYNGYADRGPGGGQDPGCKGGEYRNAGGARWWYTQACGSAGFGIARGFFAGGYGGDAGDGEYDFGGVGGAGGAAARAPDWDSSKIVLNEYFTELYSFGSGASYIHDGICGGTSGKGGGIGYQNVNEKGPPGGSGGLSTYIAAKNITIEAGGVIDVRGGNGGNANANSKAGGGGGGGGGCVYMLYETLVNNGSILVDGGLGGTGDGNGTDGDPGEVGRIYKFNLLTMQFE